MKTIYEAKGIPVLNLRRTPDGDGQILPPECHVVFGEDLPVIMYDAAQNQVGWAKLKKVGDQIVADFKLVSAMTPVDSAIALLEKLTPAVAFDVTDAHEDTILGIKITYLAVTNRGNADPSIMPFGNRIRCKSKGNLH